MSKYRNLGPETLTDETLLGSMRFLAETVRKAEALGLPLPRDGVVWRRLVEHRAEVQRRGLVLAEQGEADHVDASVPAVVADAELPAQ